MKMQSVILAEFFCIPWSYITLNCAPLASLNMLIQLCVKFLVTRLMTVNMLLSKWICGGCFGF